MKGSTCFLLLHTHTHTHSHTHTHRHTHTHTHTYKHKHTHTHTNTLTHTLFRILPWSRANVGVMLIAPSFKLCKEIKVSSVISAEENISLGKNLEFRISKQARYGAGSRGTIRCLTFQLLPFVFYAFLCFRQKIFWAKNYALNVPLEKGYITMYS